MRAFWLALLCLALLSSTLSASGAGLPKVGINFISPDWDWAGQRVLFARGHFDVAKVQIPKGFNTQPSHVEDLIRDGVTTVVLRTEDCDPSYTETRAELIDRGFLALIDRYPDVSFWVEVGNEPDNCGMDPWVYRWHLINTAQRLIPETARPNLRWAASMPTRWRDYQIVMTGGDVLDRYDGIGAHLYGWYELGDGGGGDEPAILSDLYDRGARVLLTEAGIDDSGTSTTEKVRRYLRWLSRQPPQLELVTFWTITNDPAFINYHLDRQAMDVFAHRNDT